jgi:hypothetical protein
MTIFKGKGAAWLSRVRLSSEGCGVTKFRGRRSSVISAQAPEFPPGNSPSDQQDELFTQMQKLFIPSSG